jgi:hypothetical protein
LTDQFAFIPRYVVISVSRGNLIHDELLREMKECYCHAFIGL